MDGLFPTAGKLIGILAVNVWLAAWLYAVVGTVWGKLAEKAYAARMRPGLQSWLMPGRLAQKPHYIRVQKILALLTLPIALAVYVGAMASLLR